MDSSVTIHELRLLQSFLLVQLFYQDTKIIYVSKSHGNPTRTQTLSVFVHPTLHLTLSDNDKKNLLSNHHT